MNWRKFLIFVGLVLIVTVILWGIDQGRAQQAPQQNKSSAVQTQGKDINLKGAQEQAAATRAALGLQRSVTNADRKAAAERNAARRAAAPEATKGGVTK